MRKQIYRYPLALFAAGLLAACSGDKNEGIDKEGEWKRYCLRNRTR